MLFQCFFSCLLLCHSAEGANNDDSRSSEIDTIAGAYVTEGSPGFAIAVISQGELIFLKGYGLAEIKSGRSIDVDSSFRLASVSKQFTAIAIAMLAERGKLKYEDEVSLYLKKLPWKGVTIHHLIYHTSGLPDYMELVTQHWRKEQRPVNRKINITWV